MIELKFTGKCEGCMHSELEITGVTVYQNVKVWNVHCIHDYACEEMLKKFRGEQKDG